MFKIISTSLNGDRLTARVVFVLADATEVETEMTLRSPRDEADVLKQVAAQERREQTRHDAMIRNRDLKARLDAAVTGRECVVAGRVVTVGKAVVKEENP
jgi:hypothetical protein